MTTPNKMAKGQGSVYQRKSDGLWCGTLTLPSPDPNKRVRRTVTAPSRRLALLRLAELRKDVEINGDLVSPNQTFASWAEVWFTTIALKKIAPKTAATYRSALEQYIIPVIGKIPLSKLTPAHVRKVAQGIEDKGLSSSTAHQAYRVISVCLKYAVREGRVTRNVAELTDAPQRSVPKLSKLSVTDAVKVLEVVKDDRLESRWAAALYTGARQGELLGLELDRIGDSLDLSWQLQQLSWEHGCGSLMKDKTWPCGHKTAKLCPKRKVTFPPKHEHRYLVGSLWLSRPKSKAGWRIIPLVEPLRSAIEERIELARIEPNPFGMLWTSNPIIEPRGTRQSMPVDGTPINPGTDNRAWHSILKRAEVPSVRLHDARHTTASLLLKAKVPQSVRIQILGHSSFEMMRKYEDVDMEQLSEAMESVSGQLRPPVL